jgi:hypothetical protein
MIKTVKAERVIVEDLVEDILCNICGESCRDRMAMNYEYMTCQASWGFDSTRDTYTTVFHVCEPCYDSKILPLLKIAPIETSFMWGGDDE